MASAPTIGPYRTLERIAEGGMGIVYRARHISSDRIVALKTVRVPAPRWLEGIRREIHALTQIRHPGVVRIVDHGVDQGWPWYAMDLLEGETLARFSERIWSRFRPAGPPLSPTDVVSATEGGPAESSDQQIQRSAPRSGLRAATDGPVPAAAGELRTVLKIMRRVCATLAFLHGEGLVNCDVKPDNIVLLNGEPVIIDFGLTTHHPGRSGREALEAQRGISGTPPYMSPEQLRGELVDARSDLYAIGCILYQLVTGTTPFSGSPVSIRSGHLHQAPVPPSELVGNVPQELDRLMLRLLDKDLTARFGYADEVATLLAGLCDDVHRLADFPPSRSYLYRPRLVGRDALMKELVGLRERAADGSGALVLLGGESGVGKTRLAIEITRVLQPTRMLAVTTESSTFLPEGDSASSPLRAVRPLLQAIADHCQEGGADVTERLLGERRSVLAQYEPLLAQTPAKGSLTPPVPLPVDASRRRLFEYLAETLAAFVQEQPVLWVIDDLGWADELSLSFLQSLTPDYLESTPIFILCTYRSEEVTDAVSAIAKLPHVKQLMVPRLGQDAVSAMVGDMLATQDAQDGFVEFVGKQAEGNPFFVAEYLRGAVAEHVLYRDSRHRWQMGESRTEKATDYASLPLPVSLRELIEQRLRRLSPAGHQAGLAAAVLGREADVDVLREVAGLSDEAAVAAIDELVRRQVLESTDQGRVRFGHDKLREVAYGRAPAERLMQLHARAGRAIESRCAERPDANKSWAILGQHFAAAKELEPASKYLNLAADHSRATHAHGDALRLYREAATQVDRILSAPVNDRAAWKRRLVGLHEAIGDLLFQEGNPTHARQSFDIALKSLPSNMQSHEEAIFRSRLLRRVGKTHEVQHHQDSALRAYCDAEAALGPTPEAICDDTAQRWWTEWFGVQTDRVMVHYWLADDREIESVIQRIQAAPLRHGAASQQAEIFKSLVYLGMRRERYSLSPQTVSYARRRLEASIEWGDQGQVLESRFMLGMSLLFHGHVDEARHEFLDALPLSERHGDKTLLARFLTYLTLAWRRSADVGKAREIALKCLDVAGPAGISEYIGTAHANLGWAMWREGAGESARAHCVTAVQKWDSISFVYPFQWMARFVLLAIDTEQGRFHDASKQARRILEPEQERLPNRITEMLTRSGEDGEALVAIVAMARSLGYL